MYQKNNNGSTSNKCTTTFLKALNNQCYYYIFKMFD